MDLSFDHELHRVEFVFKSIYGDEERHVYVVFRDPFVVNAWAMFCNDLDNDQIFSVDYIRMFWKLKSIKNISLCDGCDSGILNQLGHINRNGCISEDKDDPDIIDIRNQSIVEKYDF